MAQDTLKRDILLQNVIISSTRTNSKLSDIPSQVDIIEKADVKNYPTTNFDNILQSIANVYVNRSWGIFSKNASVTMRGMDGANRVLVLYNGIPLNKAAGGGINWHIISPQNVEKIEIVKGSNSALYGNNAMSGIINIVTKMPEKKLEGFANVSAGTYQTYGGKIYLAGNHIKNNKGLFWYLNGFYRKGDGYIIAPDSIRTDYDAKLRLHEFSTDFKVGYQLNERTRLTLNYNFYSDDRGDGIKIFEKNGGFIKSNSNVVLGDLTSQLKFADIQIKLFYHYDYFWQHSEKLNQTGTTYKLYDVYQSSDDYGLWLNATKKITDYYKFTLGFDFKNGTINAKDIYRTSTDLVNRKGEIIFSAIFLQNELKIAQKLNIVAGLRLDYATFDNGSIEVQNPTSSTGFSKSYFENYDNTHWLNYSPKIAFKYFFTPKVNSYFSVSKGFMPATLDDMVSSRKISKGFKIANPYLKPEKNMNYEIGINYFPSSSLGFESSFYFSQGKDFQYFVQTNELIDGNIIVFKRENIGDVTIFGTEWTAKILITPTLLLKANYTYNQSKIIHFNLPSENGTDLTNKYLAEIPSHKAFFGLFWNSKLVSANVVCNFIGQQWGEEENITTLKPYTLFDLLLYREFANHFSLSANIQNIFDIQYIDKKGGMAPGRYITIEFQVNF